MVGKTSAQRSLFEASHVYQYRLAPDSFYGQLAAAKDLFTEADFADMYCSNNGRPSIPPVLMALLMILQYFEGLSDERAIHRTEVDLCWAVVMGRELGTPLCGRSTLIDFRARLALHDGVDRLFQRVLERAQQRGLLRRDLRVLVDTRAIVGRGAVEDTYNLLAHAIHLLIAVLAAAADEPIRSWAARHGLEHYLRRRDSSLKGEAEIDWSDRAARQSLLRAMVTDARRLLGLAEGALPGLTPRQQRDAREQMALLEQILRQDVVERRPARTENAAPAAGPPDSPPPTGAASEAEGDGETGAERVAEAAPEPDPQPGEPSTTEAELRRGTAKDRVPSATDPDQRHGHKSQNRRFTGHKARVAVDAQSQLVVDVEVLAGNAADADGVLQQIQRLGERVGTVTEVVGDCAFASGAVREEFEHAGHTLRAKQPAPGAPAWGISKDRFKVIFEGEEATSVRCPAGHEVSDYRELSDGRRVFNFAPHCNRCPLRHKCVRAQQIRKGRSIHVHPQEKLLQAAREYQNTEEGRETLRQRLTVEHTLARLARLGIGQARYFGRTKTRVQMVLACATANLRRLFNWENDQALRAAATVG